MFLALLLLICWPVAEVFVAIEVAHAVGVLVMLLLLIASWPIGSWALRAQGRAAWRRLGEAVAASKPPGKEVLNGALVVAGGVLLIVPGFITDAVGACLLLPPTRALMRRLLVRNLRSRLVLGVTGVRRAPSPYDVDSTATEIDQPQLRP